MRPISSARLVAVCQWSVIFVLQLLSSVSAHIIVYSDLQGLPLCVEPRTVQVAIFDAADAPLRAEAASVKAALEQTLKTTLRRYDIPFASRDDCSGEAAFVYVLYYADKQPEEDDDPWIIFSSLIQVGEVPDEVTASFMTNLPNGLHENYTAVMYYLDELGDDPIRTLQATTEEMIEELANSWWEDYLFVQELRQQARLQQLQYASFGLTLLISIGGILVLVLRRRNRRRQSRLKTDRLSS